MLQPDVSQFKDQLYGLSYEELVLIDWKARWIRTSRPKQLPPPGDWWLWLVNAGRGFGKTRTGAEWIGDRAISQPKSRWLVTGPTAGDVRDVCFEGESGLLNTIPPPLIRDYNRSLSEIFLINDSLIKGIPASEPGRFRGPQWHGGWHDELAAWDYLEEAWDMIQFSMRLGSHPRQIATTTPRPLPFLKTLLREKGVVVTTGTTYENKDNLAPKFLQNVLKYEGTRIGRQEIYAEILDEEEGAIFTRSWFQLWPADEPFPRLLYIIQSYDTAFTADSVNHPTASTTWGVFYHDELKRNCLILLDCWMDWLEYPDLRKKARIEYNTQYGPEDVARRPDLVLVEEKATGKPLMQDLQLAGVPVRGYNPGRADKIQRAHSVSHFPAHGLVYLPESTNNPGRPRNWAEPMLDQIVTFSAETLESTEKMKVSDAKRHHFDYVDTFTQVLAWLRDSRWLTVDVKPEEDAPPPPRERRNPYAA